MQKNECNVIVPYFRTDVTLSEDLIEEILRIYGYDRIPESLPISQTPHDIQSSSYVFEEQIRDILSKMGFDEHILEPLTVEKTSTLQPIILENALTSEKQMLRTTLQHGLLKVFETYKKHRRDDIKIFEIGKIYFINKTYYERKTVGILLSSKTVSYRDAKGAIESLSVSIGKKLFEKDYFIIPIDENTYYIELNSEALFKNENIDAVVVHTSPMKIVLQDLSLIAPRSVKIGEVLQGISTLDKRILNVSLGENPKIIDAKTQSLFLQLTFHNTDNTNFHKDNIELLRNNILHYLHNTYSIKLAEKK